MAEFTIYTNQLMFSPVAGNYKWNDSTQTVNVHRKQRCISCKHSNLVVEHDANRCIIFKRKNADNTYSYQLFGDGKITKMTRNRWGQVGWESKYEDSEFDDDYASKNFWLNPTLDASILDGKSTNVTFNTRKALPSGKVLYHTSSNGTRNTFNPISYNNNSGNMSVDDSTVVFGKCIDISEPFTTSEYQTPSRVVCIGGSDSGTQSTIGIYKDFQLISRTKSGALEYTQYLKRVVDECGLTARFQAAIDGTEQWTYEDLYSGFLNLLSQGRTPYWIYPDDTVKMPSYSDGSPGNQGMSIYPYEVQTDGTLFYRYGAEDTGYTDEYLHSGYEGLIFMDIYITENRDAAIKYVQDGTIPSDATITSSGDKPTPPPEPEPEDDGTGSKIEKQDMMNPEESGLTIGNTHYFLIGVNHLSEFMRWFWNPGVDISSILQNWLFDLYGDLTQYLVGMYFFPIQAKAFTGRATSSEIIIGRFGSGLYELKIDENPKLFEIGNINTADAWAKRYNSFLDLEPYTRYQIYLPYYGVADLPTNTVNQLPYIHVLAVVDVPTQQLKYIVRASKNGKAEDGINIFETAIPFGDSIPINMQSGLETTAKLVDATIGTAASIGGVVASGGLSAPTALMAAESASDNFHNISSKPSMIGTSNGVMGKWGSYKCMLLIEQPIERDSARYGSTVGYPSMQTKKMDDLHGYVELENPILNFGQTLDDGEVVYPLSSEVDELAALLMKGVYIDE